MRVPTRHGSWIVLPALLLAILSLLGPAPAICQERGEPRYADPKQVAELVRERVLGGEFGERTLWTTERPLDPTHVARDLVAGRSPDLPFPYPRTWLVMIDDQPDANFGHPVRWLFVDADTGETGPAIVRDFPPVVLSQGGNGPAVEFRCRALTAKACPELAVRIPIGKLVDVTRPRSCLHAVLVSGGISSGSNYDRYRQNLRSMYQILRGAGYPKAQISVYYADGASLDLDNADGDNSDATGNDVTAGADEGTIRARIQQLCDDLDPRRDILFTYFSNHGADDDGVCLWDGNNNGLQAGELYSPAELAADTADCAVCRHFMIHDQCFAGDFLPMAGDGQHANLAVYAAASATEVSWGREYLDRWEDNDATTTEINDMHDDVVANGNLNSTPGMAEGTPGLGDVLIGRCCRWLFWWPWWLVIAVVVFIPIWWVLRRRRLSPAH
ncbi:MAG: hypothetical protein H6Q03_433 [Acidobacteria bacterium]|jgi:hypothetical protein|nr:hypothetical protein [Acidobacteriota bacterium]